MIKDFLLAQFVERITPWRDLCRRCSLKHHLKQFKDLGVGAEWMIREPV